MQFNTKELNDSLGEEPELLVVRVLAGGGANFPQLLGFLPRKTQLIITEYYRR